MGQLQVSSAILHTEIIGVKLYINVHNFRRFYMHVCTKVKAILSFMHIYFSIKKAMKCVLVGVGMARFGMKTEPNRTKLFDKFKNN